MFSGSLVAIVTPMRADGAIDLEAWDALLDLHVQAGTTGIVVGGTTGESTTLSEREVFDLLRRAKVRLQEPRAADRRDRQQQYRRRGASAYGPVGRAG